MVVVFFYKIKLWDKIKTVVLLLLLFFISESVVKASDDKNRKSLNADVQKKKKVKKKKFSGYQIHFERQTKKVQKRMKEDGRKTKKFYNQKLGYTLLQRLFGKNKNR